jgi:shikimate kinase
MPGGGKTTVGRLLARQLGWRFIDCDVEIQTHLGCSIRHFFAQQGEAAFRTLEEQVLAQCLGQGALVLSTGGGVVLSEPNRLLLRQRSVAVYLHSTPDELYRRLRHDTQRPLLQVPDPQARLQALYAQRDSLYREVAQFVIETGRPSVHALLNMVLMQLELAGIAGRLDR